MIEVTEPAIEMLSGYMKEQNITSPLRVFMSSGCCGASLGLAADSPKEGDHEVQAGNISLLIEKGLLDALGSVKIDFKSEEGRSGLSIESKHPLPAPGGNSCGTDKSGGCGCSGGAC